MYCFVAKQTGQKLVCGEECDVSGSEEQSGQAPIDQSID